MVKRPAYARVLPAVIAVVLVMAVLAVGYRARRAADLRIAELGACLFGEPLQHGEKASERMLRIDLARPHARLVRRAGKLEPEDRSASWPATCAGPAHDAAASRLLSARDRAYLELLAVALGDEKTDFDAISRAADDAWSTLDAPAAVTTVGRPWKPVTLVAKREGASALGCEPYVIAADTKLAIIGGTPGCTLESTDTEQWGVLRAREDSDRPAPTPKLPKALAALRGSRARATPTCVAGAMSVSALDVETDDPRRRELVVAFFDAKELTSEPLHVTVTSRFGAGEQKLQVSHSTTNCRPGEARIAWAWATSIDQKATEEIVVVTCVPGSCTVRTSEAHVETPRMSNCGYCSPSPDELLVTAPTVVDLFGTAALLWRDSRSMRARIAPLERLDAVVDTVLWYDPDPAGAEFGEPWIHLGAQTAIFGLSHGERLRETRLFKVTADGARELVSSTHP